MLEAIGSALSEVISWVGQVLTALISTEGALHDLLIPLAVGISVSVLMLAAKAIRSFIWGA